MKNTLNCIKEYIFVIQQRSEFDDIAMWINQNKFRICRKA